MGSCANIAANVGRNMVDARFNAGVILGELNALCLAHNHGGEMWRPRMYRALNPEDAEGLVELLRDGPEITVFDTLGAQLRELVETRNPGLTLTRREMVKRIEAQLNGVAPVQYGVWVYYPWSRRLVHILDRDEFVELRTTRNRYRITAEEQHVLSTKKVGIVGQSVGQSVALTMVMERSLGEIRLADFDTLGLSNLNRLRAGLHNLNVPKVYITAREIAEIDPFVVVKCYPDGVAHDTIDDFLLSGGRLDLLIDECDGLDIKVWLRHHARDHRIPVLMETSDRCLVDVERYDFEPDRAIFHGLIDDLDPAQIGDLTNYEKVPYVLQIIGEPTMSHRGRASMVEVGNSIKTWPQLASAVTMGGGIAADVARRMNLGYLRESGRFWVDVEQLIPDTPPAAAPAPPPAAPHTPLSVATMIELSGAAPRVADAAPIQLPPELRDRLLAAAIAAPTGGNAQPWRWFDHEGRLHLFRDRTRSFSLADFNGTGAVVGLGAAAENLVLAAHHERIAVAVKPFPAGEAHELVASFEFFAESNPATEPHWRDDLFECIAARHTNRKWDRKRLEESTLAALAEAIGSVPGAEVQFLTEEADLAAVGELVGAGDRLRLLNEDCNREMMAELRWTPEEVAATRDGLSLDALELTRTDRAGFAICRNLQSIRLVKAWGGGKGFAKPAIDAISNCGAVGLLTMPSPEMHQFFAGGRAMERMWLVAHALQLALHPMTTLPYMFARVLRGNGEGFDQPMIDELLRLREPYCRLFKRVSDSAEVLLFRVSKAVPATARSLRRSIEDVLVIA